MFKLSKKNGESLFKNSSKINNPILKLMALEVVETEKFGGWGKETTIIRPDWSKTVIVYN